jgi:hypothetical protein
MKEICRHGGTEGRRSLTEPETAMPSTEVALLRRCGNDRGDPRTAFQGHLYVALGVAAHRYLLFRGGAICFHPKDIGFGVSQNLRENLSFGLQYHSMMISVLHNYIHVEIFHQLRIVRIA